MLSQEQDIVFDGTLQVAESRIDNVWMTTVKYKITFILSPF